MSKEYKSHGCNVECFYCCGVFDICEDIGVPWIAHAIYYPYCGFLRISAGKLFIDTVQYIAVKQTANLGLDMVKAKMGNLPFCFDSRMEKFIVKRGTSVYTMIDLGCTENDLRSFNINDILKNIKTFTDAKKPRYSLHYHRCKSFRGWPKKHSIRPKELSAAGFYFPGPGLENSSDYFWCFYCGGGVANWELGMNPWLVHASIYPFCGFLKQVVGQHFIDSVQDIRREKKITMKKIKAKMGYLPVCVEYSGASLSSEQKSNESDKSDYKNNSNKDICQQLPLCKICLGKIIDTVFMPCGHLVSCSECFTALENCPICREKIEGIANIFMS